MVLTDIGLRITKIHKWPAKTTNIARQNRPPLNPLIQGYSLGYREAGAIRGLPGPRALDPEPLRLGQVTLSDGCGTAGCTKPS